MTVRVNKPAFNIREKLSELERPIGAKGHDLMRAETAQNARDFISAGRKNMIINGQMFINQRNGTNSYSVPNATGGSYGGPDRWAINEATDGSVSVLMDGDPRGSNGSGYDVQEFAKAMLISCQGTDTGLASTQNLHFFQNIEGYNIVPLAWGTPSAKPATLSFWVRCNLPGTYCVGLENSATDKCCIKEYTVNPGHKWQKVVLTFPGCTSGTWESTYGCGIRVRFALSSGEQYDDGIDGEWVDTDELTTGNQVNFMTSTNNRYFITGVQLEVGENATDFEHRQYGEELELCQRYYEQNLSSQYTATGYHTSYIRSGMQFQVIKRTTPTVTLTNAVNSAGTSLSLSTGGANTMGFNYSMNSAGTSYGVRFDYTADAEL
jgi:hypothetical protein